MSKLNVLPMVIFSTIFGALFSVGSYDVYAQDCSACTGPGEYVCGSTYGANDMCCTGGGCPSFSCSYNSGGYNDAHNCGGTWTCCLGGPLYPDPCNQAVCTPEWIYLTAGTCEYCPASGGGGGGGGGTTYGKITGRMFSDYNRDNQPNSSGETWSKSTSTCAVYKSDTLNNTIGGSNIIPGTGWLCDGAGAYSVSNDIVTGAKDITLVGTLPGSINCGIVKWSYSTSSSASDAKSGNGCIASGLNITTGANYLWWWAVPNTPPTVTLSPTSISYSSAGEVYPVKVGIIDPDPNGAIKIPSTLTAGLGNLRQTAVVEFRAYGNQYNGQWPIARIYGWRKDTGVRVLIADAWRGGATDILIDSSTPKWFYVGLPWGDINTYSHFDFEFINDIWDPVTRTGTDIFVDNMSFFQDDPMWDWYPYVVEAENASWVQYDRGDTDDGYDVISPSTATASNGGNTYSMMAWGGALRFPVLWVAPSTAVSGNLTFNVSDQYGVVVSRSVSINPLYRTISGRVWKIPPGTTINDTYCANNQASGGSGTLTSGTITAYNTGRSSGINNTYSITGVYGYVDNLTLSNIASPPVYRLACVNGIVDTGATGLTTTNFPHTSSTNQTINIGLREITAKKWEAAQSSDVYANSILMALPPVACTTATNPLCPVFTNPTETPTYFTLGYNPSATPGSLASSSIFTGEPISVGPSRLSESNISITNANLGQGQKFRQKNSKYLSSNLRSLVDTLYAKAGTGAKTSVPISYSTNSITVLSKTVNSIPDGLSYTVSGGLAFLIVPKSGSTTFVINDLTPAAGGRLVIIADRDIEIGSLIYGSSSGNAKTTASQVSASIITTGNITIKNNPATSSSSPGTLIIDGPLISGKDIKLDRDLTAVVNEVRPALFVKFNPFYLTELNKIGIANTIPDLNPLFVFDFSQKGD